MGIVTADMLRHGRYPDALWRCGGVELRADGIPPDDIAGRVADFDNEKTKRGFTGPVLFTLRLVRDGGAWPNENAAERNAVWESLPPGTCDWVDLEIEETSRIALETLDSLRSSGVKILLSHHAFEREEPSSWEGTLSTMRVFKPDGVKFAVMPDANQVPTLLDFARRVGAEFPESCVLGMGVAGMNTRLVSPLLGCPFTYGYLGEGPVAPGQLKVETMREFFAKASDSFPGIAASNQTILEWADVLYAQVNHGR